MFYEIRSYLGIGLCVLYVHLTQSNVVRVCACVYAHALVGVCVRARVGLGGTSSEARGKESLLLLLIF